MFLLSAPQLWGGNQGEDLKDKIFFGSLYQRFKNTYFEWPQMRIGSFTYFERRYCERGCFECPRPQK